MILANLITRESASKKQIVVRHSSIEAIENNDTVNNGTAKKIWFDDAIALPGFINSHDHLDFNLFPQLANGKYNNYKEWGNDIHAHNKASIDAVSKIPVSLRTAWGRYKNLFNGFTTVVNHGNKLNDSNDLISIFEDCYSLHSAGFEKRWKWKLNDPFRTRRPFVMHIGEGTDKAAQDEIDEVIQANWFRKKIIAVHGIQMNRLQAGSFAGLAWCPASNFFLTGETADVSSLKEVIPVVFGTDSALSASWNAWEHFRAGLADTKITEDELVNMLTEIPASLWGLNDRGILAAGKRADILIVKKKTGLFSANPEDILLVMHKGEIKLYDGSLASQLPGQVQRSFSRVYVNGNAKFVQGDLAGLISRILLINPAQDIPLSLAI